MNSSYLLLRPLLVWLFLFQAVGAADRDKVHVGPTPDWAVNVPYELEGQPPEDQKGWGVYHLLLDNQHHVEKREIYRRSVRRVLNDSGVQEEGTVEITFNPAYQELTLHAIRLLRAGDELDRLAPAELRVIQRESELERNVFDGTVSVLAILEDLRAGDVVETAYTLAGANPVFGDKFSISSYLQWSVPVALQHTRVLVPSDRKLQVKSHQLDLLPVISNHGGLQELVWLQNDVQPLQTDGHLPGWYDPYAWLQVTEYSSWQEVADWGAAIYPFSGEPMPELRERVQAIRDEHSRPEDQAIAAIRLVQDQVRYTGVNLGEHSHAPNAPEKVLRRRFGDCKDKSYLLCMLLRELGFEAWPAVVDTREKEHVEQWLPTPFAFNHVIVQMRIEDREYWVDATISHQRGNLEKLPMLPYRKALLLKPDIEGLVPVIGANSPDSSARTKESYEIGEGDAPTKLHVNTRYTGSRADSIRSYLARTSRGEVEKNYEQYYATWWSAVQWVGGIEWQDDEVENIVTVVENYTIPKIWNEEDGGDFKDIYFRAQAIKSYIDKPSAHRRSMPLKVPFPLAVEQVIEVMLPADWEVDPEVEVVEDEAVRFKRYVNYDKRLLTMGYELTTLKDHVLPEQAASHVRNLTKIENATGYYISAPVNETAAMGALQDVAEPRNPVNWAMVVTTLSVLAGSALVGWWVFRYRPVGPPQGEWIDHRLVGLGGWLLLVGLGLILSVIRSLVSCFTYSDFYGMNYWSALTTPGGESYHPLWAPMLLLESGMTISLVVFSAVTLVLFFKRRTSFPRVMIALVTLGLATGLFSAIGGSVLPVDAETTNESWTAFARASVSAAIWIPYLLVSKRVRATFRS